MATAAASSAAVVTITSNAADYGTNSLTGVSTTNAITSIIGYQGATGGRSDVFVSIFALPTLPTGQVVGGATSFTVTADGTSAASGVHGDLFGVGSFPNSTAAVNYSPTDYTTGASAGSPVKLQDDLLVKPATAATAAVPVVYTTSAAGGSALQAYLQSFYDANPTYDASAGQRYVFLRLNQDAISNSTGNRYTVRTADNTGGGVPTLNIEFAAPAVPEPASLAALVVGGLTLARRRRA